MPDSESKTPTALIVLLVAAVAGVVLGVGGYVAVRWMRADVAVRDELTRAEIAEQAAAEADEARRVIRPERGPMTPAERGGGKLYFPTTVGSERVMGSTGERTEVVTKVEEKGGVYTVTVDYEDVADVGTYTVEVSARGVANTSGGGPEGDDPYLLLKLGAGPGVTWDVTRPGAGPTAKARRSRCTLGAEEEVVVPAGTFTAVRVDVVTDTGDGAPHKSTLWYAAGVGLVKLVVYTTDGGKRDRVLKSFTPGDEQKK